jgi:hypothetical protein
MSHGTETENMILANIGCLTLKVTPGIKTILPSAVVTLKLCTVNNVPQKTCAYGHYVKTH